MQHSNKVYPFVLLSVVIMGLVACKSHTKTTSVVPKNKTAEQIAAIKGMPEQYCALLSGDFIVQQQNKAGEMVDRFIYHNLPVFEERWGEYWIYSEGSMANLVEEPFDQSVMQVKKHTVDTLYIYSYRIKDRERFNMAWYDRDKLKNLTFEDLIPGTDDDCMMIAVKKGNNQYVIEDKGLCHIEDGNNKKTYTHTTINVSYEGLCFSSIWYDNTRQISIPAPEECHLYNRDLEGKYYKLELEKRKKQQKTAATN